MSWRVSGERPGRAAAAIALLLAAVSARADEPSVQNRPRPQVAVAQVEKMPRLPSPFRMIDWKERARGFDRLVFDEKARGPHLPLVQVVEPARAGDFPRFSLPSYVGGDAGQGEGVCTLGALMGGSLAGLDKTRQAGRDWVAMSRFWFNPATHQRIVLNNPGSHGGGSFWYDVLPGVVFCQLAERDAQAPGMTQVFRAMADRYREVVEALGGPRADFNFTAFDFDHERGTFNGQWREPDAAAGIGWIEYAAWQTWHEPRYLEAAGWCLDSFQRRPADAGSPLYETLMFYAPTLAARFNAEQGGHYDVDKLVNWCLAENQDERSARRGWGICAARFGNVDAHGLQSSTWRGDEYAFAMNTFHAAGAMTPLVRYDERYARAVGKWLLHLANNARLFYPDALPATNQSPPHWPGDLPPVIPYEGLRAQGRQRGEFLGQMTAHGHVRGAVDDGRGHRQDQTLIPEGGVVEHVWEFQAPAGVKSGSWYLWFQTRAPAGTFLLSFRTSADGSWTPAAYFPRDADRAGDHIPMGGGLGDVKPGARVAIKVATARPSGAVEVRVDDVRCEFNTSESPYATGDPIFFRWGPPTDFGVYGGAYVGYLAALVERTNCEHVLQIDLLATDFFRANACPTFLYYNPDPEPRRVRIDVGKAPRDLYDTVTKRFLARRVSNLTEFTLPPDAAAVVVLVPSDASVRRVGRYLLGGDVVIDWNP